MTDTVTQAAAPVAWPGANLRRWTRRWSMSSASTSGSCGDTTTGAGAYERMTNCDRHDQ